MKTFLPLSKAILILSLLSLTSGCIKSKKRSYPQASGEIVEQQQPTPEVADGCANLVGNFMFQEGPEFSELIISQQTEGLMVELQLQEQNLKILTGQDPIETDDGSSLVASCNSSLLSVGVSGIEVSFFYKFRLLEDSTIEATKLNDKGQVEAVFKGLKK